MGWRIILCEVKMKYTFRDKIPWLERYTMHGIARHFPILGPVAFLGFYFSGHTILAYAILCVMIIHFILFLIAGIMLNRELQSFIKSTDKDKDEET